MDDELINLVSNVSIKCELSEIEEKMDDVLLFDPRVNYNELEKHYNILIETEIEELCLGSKYLDKLQLFLTSLSNHIKIHSFDCIDSECRDCILGRMLENVYKSSNNRQIIHRTIKAFDYIFDSLITREDKRTIENCCDDTEGGECGEGGEGGEGE